MDLEKAKAVSTPGEEEPTWKLEDNENTERSRDDPLQDGCCQGELPGDGSHGYPICNQRVLQRDGQPSASTPERAEEVSQVPSGQTQNGVEVWLASQRRSEGLFRFRSGRL